VHVATVTYDQSMIPIVVVGEEPMKVLITRTVDALSPEAKIARDIHDSVRCLYRHEVDEWVTFDGVHIVDPHPETKCEFNVPAQHDPTDVPKQLPVDRTLHLRFDRAYIVGVITGTGEAMSFPLPDEALDGGQINWTCPVQFTPERVEFRDSTRPDQGGAMIIRVTNEKPIPAGWTYTLTCDTPGRSWT